MEQKSGRLFEIWKVENPAGTQIVRVDPTTELPIPAELEDAVYTSIRTYFRGLGVPKYLEIDRHFSRLHESLTIEDRDYEYDDHIVKQAVTMVVARSAFRGELRIKIIIAPRRQDPIMLMIEPLKTPSSEDIRKGVSVYTTNYIRKDPKAKLFEFVEIQDQIRGQFGQHVEEIIMLDASGGMLEGLSSNFFVVMGGSLFTAGRGILNGITREIVLEIARREQMHVVLSKPNISQVDRFEECLITSTSRGILPVVAIDHKAIGPGRPGPITVHLRMLFEEKIPDLVEPL